MPTKPRPKVKVTSHAATVARIRVRFDHGYDLTEVARYFIAKGVPYALAAVINESPRRGAMANPDHRVEWYEDDDFDGQFLTIEVTLVGESQGYFYLGEGS